MRFSTVVALFAAVASASAASLTRRQNLPDCAMNCITNSPRGECSLVDNPCLCRNEEFVTTSTACITSTCTGADLETALTTAVELCAGEGVDLGNDDNDTPTEGGDDEDSDDTPSTTSSDTPSPSATSPGNSQETSGGAGGDNGAMTHGVSAAAGIAAIAFAAIAL